MSDLLYAKTRVGITVGYHFHYADLGAFLSILFNPFQTSMVFVICLSLCAGLSTTYGCAAKRVVFSGFQLSYVHVWNGFQYRMCRGPLQNWVRLPSAMSAADQQR